MLKNLLFFLLFQLSAGAQNLPNDVTVRKGLPNFSWKLKHNMGDTVRIAFLGGSITQAENGWRDKTFNWIKQQYPSIKFKQINAAIGGTGSGLGVYRVGEQVLKYKPDLLFVEFAVNDFSEPRTAILKSMEGIVRKTINANATTDICFVYTITNDIYNMYNNNGIPVSIAAMEELASYYRIPSVNFGVAITQLLNDKKLFIKGPKPNSNDSSFFSGDGGHPYPETGHKIYAETMAKSLKQLLLKAAVFNHTVYTPYYSDSMQNSSMIDVLPYMQKGGIKSIKDIQEDMGQKFTNLLPNLLLLNDTLQEIAFSFTGNRIGFMDVIGPSSAQITVSIDKDAPRYINRFDSYCFYFSRMHWFFIDGLSNGKHYISIKLSPVQPDKFLLLDKENERSTLEKPEEYEKFIWRVGKILIPGTL